MMDGICLIPLGMLLRTKLQNELPELLVNSTVYPIMSLVR